MGKRTIDLLLILSFVVILGAPFLLFLAGKDQYNSYFPGEENMVRPKLNLNWTNNFSPSPSWARDVYVSFIDYKYEIDRYFTEHVAFKYDLFDRYVWLFTEVFDAEPMPHKVVEGRDEMLFCGSWHDDYIRSSIGFREYDSTTVTSVAKEIERQANWCKQREISYYFAVAPNKLSVYGENLPIQNYGNAPLRELVAQSLPPTVNYIDLTPTLLKKKAQYKLYRKADTHWNPFGAYFAYEELMGRMHVDFEEIVPIPLDNYSIDSIVGLQNDLIRQIRKPTNEYQTLLTNKTEPNAVFQKRVYRPEETEIVHDFYQDYEKRYRNDSKPLKILVFRDSFCCAMVDFIRESFGESVLIWDTTFDTQIIENEKPDIVLTLMVERHLESKLGGPH